jgi:hypothetical protein
MRVGGRRRCFGRRELEVKERGRNVGREKGGDLFWSLEFRI